MEKIVQKLICEWDRQKLKLIYGFLLKIFFKFHSTVKTVYTLSYIYVSTALYNLQGSARHIESDKKKIVPH